MTTTTRTCPGCGYKFTAIEPGEVYCSRTCESAAGMASVYAGLQRIARVGSPGTGHP